MSDNANAAGFTGQKAMFKNMQEDGMKYRATKFKNKKAYDRKRKHKANGWS